MRMKLFLLVCLAVLSSASAATEADFKLCTAGGYFSGAQERFFSGLAMHIVAQRKLHNSTCSAQWKKAYAVGESFSKTGEFRDQEEADIVQQASEFSAKVYKLISSNVDF